MLQAPFASKFTTKASTKSAVHFIFAHVHIIIAAIVSIFRLTAGLIARLIAVSAGFTIRAQVHLASSALQARWCRRRWMRIVIWNCLVLLWVSWMEV